MADDAIYWLQSHEHLDILPVEYSLSMATDKKADMSGEGSIQREASTQVGSSDDNAKLAQTREADQAARFLATVGPFPPMSPEQEKKLVRKIDRWMIPLVWAPG